MSTTQANRPMTPTLFQKLLGASFYALPDPVRALHGVSGHRRYVGRAQVVRGRNPLARACARIAGLPPASRDVAVTATFDNAADQETWHRDFGGHRLSSTLRQRERQLAERLGPVQFRFALHVYDNAIHWRVVRVRVFGLLPLPASWFAGVVCREGERDGRYTFDVDAALPLLGRLVHYAGWLEPA